MRIPEENAEKIPISQNNGEKEEPNTNAKTDLDSKPNIFLGGIITGGLFFVHRK